MAPNGCSGGISRIYGLLNRNVPFLFCCDEHDLAYEEGGIRTDRALADRRFRECVRESGRPVRAWLLFCAVRLFGWLFWGKGRPTKMPDARGHGESLLAGAPFADALLGAAPLGDVPPGAIPFGDATLGGAPFAEMPFAGQSQEKRGA